MRRKGCDLSNTRNRIYYAINIVAKSCLATYDAKISNIPTEREIERESETVFAHKCFGGKLSHQLQFYLRLFLNLNEIMM